MGAEGHTNFPQPSFNVLTLDSIESLLDNSKLFTSIDSSPQQTEDVAMLLSGGVDSSVALNLLLEEGYSVRAFYLKIWLEDELSHLGQCPWEDDWAMCQQVCMIVIFVYKL